MQQVVKTVELENQTNDAEMECTDEKPDEVAEKKKEEKSLGLEDSSVVLVEDSNDPEKEADEKTDADMEIIETSG